MTRIVPFTLTVAISALAACGETRPQSTVTPGLDTGITSSSGGGTQTLRNNPNVGVTTPAR